MATSKIVREFKLKSSGQVKLSISFFDLSRGQSKVWLEDDRIDNPDALGTVKNLVVGNASSLKGKSLFISSRATDFNPYNNRTSVVYDLTNGTPDAPLADAKDAESDGGRVAYTALINFV